MTDIPEIGHTADFEGDKENIEDNQIQKQRDQILEKSGLCE